MRVAIRVDASVEMGVGHLMRCMTLGIALKKMGNDVEFCCRDLPPYWKQKLLDLKFPVHELPGAEDLYEHSQSAASRWLKVSQSTDAQDTISALGAKKFDWLLIDHYALDHLWEVKCSEVADRIMVIDDLANRNHVCDVLLDQNYFEDSNTRYRNLVNSNTLCLLGPKFALLRPEFGDKREQKKVLISTISRVLVSFGGADANNWTQSVVDALSSITAYSFDVVVVVGSIYPHIKHLKQSCELAGFRLHVQPDNFSDLMKNSDLAIGGGGSMNWERFCLGVPTFAVALAENQEQILKGLASAGLIYSPSPAENSKYWFAIHLARLFDSPSLLRMYSEKGFLLVDGHGVARVAKELSRPNVKVLPATMADCDEVFRWRNSKTVRKFSTDSKPLDLTQHKKWFEKVIGDSGRLLFIGWIDEEKVGCIRFDVQRNTAEVSVFLAPDGMGRGIGTAMMQQAEMKLTEKFPALTTIIATVLSANDASQRLFEKLGYEKTGQQFEKTFAK